jgi:DNA-binding NarL/FixJ family response regulator
MIMDDHAAVREALVARLGAEPDFEVRAAPVEVDAGLAEVIAWRPQIVLLEPKRADGRGLELLNRVTQAGSGARVVVLTSYTSSWELWGTHRSAAEVYLLKDIDSGRLVERLRAMLVEPPRPPAIR